MKRFYLVATVVVAALPALSACRTAKAPDAYGNIEATEVVVGSQASGQLTAFTPAEGDVVAAGAITAVVDTSALVLQLDQIASQRLEAASRVDEAAKQIGVLEAQRAIALRNFERTKRLFDQQAATAQQLDQAERDYKTLTAQIEAARAQQRTVSHAVASVGARMAQVRDQIGKARVSNPIAGTVLATYVKAGEIVQPGQALYRVANLDTMELRAYVTEPQLAQVQLGRTVAVSVDAGDARRVLSGVVSWISSKAEFTPTPIETRDERANLVYAIKVRIANPNGALKIGMPADIQFSSVVASK
ncbi:MAG: HlyD family efflux transporter periplasmic adaptor subunit [Gemmatimonadaceae bacterium]